MKSQWKFVANLFDWFAERGYHPHKALSVFAPDMSKAEKNRLLRKLNTGVMTEDEFKVWEKIKRRIVRNEQKGKREDTGAAE